MNLAAIWSERPSAALVITPKELFVLQLPVPAVGVPFASLAVTWQPADTPLPFNKVLAVAENDVLGSPKLAWFKTLNASTRNCNLNRSVISVVLKIEKSKVCVPGPRT